MKMKLNSALTMFVVAALLVSSVGFLKPAYAAPRIYMTPNANNFDTNTAYVGKEFNITIWIQDSPQIGAGQVYMEFNDDILRVTKWYVPLMMDPTFIFFNETTSGNPTPPDPGYIHLSPGKGRVMVAVNLMPTPPTQPPGSGSGKLCIFTLQIFALPEKQQNLGCVLAINKANTMLLDPNGVPVPGVIKEDGSYSIIWAIPASPHMGFDSTANITFGPEKPSAIGVEFDVPLYIKDLSAAWYLTTASFTLNYDTTVIDIVGGTADVTVDALWTVSTVTVNPGVLSISVGSPSTNPADDVLVATVKFTVMNQNVGSGATLATLLTFTDVFFFDHIGPIPAEPSESRWVEVKPLRLMELPWFEVVPPSITLGPNPVRGELFDVGIMLTGPAPLYLDAGWMTVGNQFKLSFDNTLIEPVAVTEGPFFLDPQWNLHGTFYTGIYDPDASYVLVGELLLPNNTGDYDQTVFPGGSGIVTTITFVVLDQRCPDPFTTDLTLSGVFGQWLIDKEGGYVEVDVAKNVNGLVTILPFDQPGRMLDLYGGAKNDGYWTGYPAPFPAPYGGQGPNHWMDIVFPQAEVTLYAYLTYNYWPVQSKQVGFEIEGPYMKDPQGGLVPMQRYQIWAKLTATTDANGVATLTYRMPWPCEDPDGITGIWKITSTATVADTVIMDTTIFYYERAVYITKVTTDSFYYDHEQNVVVTVEYQTHAVQSYPALFSVVITDDLGVPFGMALVSTTVGGATFCTWKTGNFEVSIFIPKWAYAGYGHVHVNCYDKDPTDGGFAYVPEYAPAPEIQIGPY